MRKKIAFILQDLTGGGAERTVSNLSFKLSEFYDFYIIVFNGKNVSYPHNATILNIDVEAKDGILNKCVNVLRRVSRVKKLKREYHFDIVVGFMFSACIVNVLSRTNEKIISSARNYMSAYGTSVYQVQSERFIAKHSDYVVAISEMVRRDLIKNFGIDEKKTTTIYNPCDANRIREYAKQVPDYQFDKDKFYFINIGRLVRQKGQWDLIKAFSIVNKKHEKTRLLILGGFGNNEIKLKELAERMKVSDSVVFAGFKDNPFAYLGQSNVFVLSSLHEGLGNVILEALACRIPVISTDCFAGPREILAPNSVFSNKADGIEREEYGVLVPEISSEEDYSDTIETNHAILADAMCEFVENDTLSSQYREKSDERVKDFDPDLIAKQWVCLFNKLLRDEK